MNLRSWLEDIAEAVQALETDDVIKSETAPSLPHSKLWHDINNMRWNNPRLYSKFAGETLTDATLTSFKEAGNE